MLSKFFIRQSKNPLKGDWCLTVIEDMKNVGLDCYTYDDIKNMTKN